MARGSVTMGAQRTGRKRGPKCKVTRRSTSMAPVHKCVTPTAERKRRTKTTVVQPNDDQSEKYQVLRMSTEPVDRATLTSAERRRGARDRAISEEASPARSVTMKKAAPARSVTMKEAAHSDHCAAAEIMKKPEMAAAWSEILKKTEAALEMMKKTKTAAEMTKKMKTAAEMTKKTETVAEMPKKAKMVASPPPQQVIETTGKHSDADDKNSSSEIDYYIRRTGFDYLEAEKIMKVVKLERNNHENIMFLVKWKNVMLPELVLCEVMNKRYSIMVLEFYQSVIQWDN